MRAKVRASLANSGPINRLTAARARVAGLLVDLEIVLEGPTPVDPVDTRSVGLNSAYEGEPYRFEEPGGLLDTECVAGLPRVDAGLEKCFISIDIT